MTDSFNTTHLITEIHHEEIEELVGDIERARAASWPDAWLRAQCWKATGDVIAEWHAFLVDATDPGEIAEARRQIAEERRVRQEELVTRTPDNP